jgi:hypothetical protein
MEQEEGWQLAGESQMLRDENLKYSQKTRGTRLRHYATSRKVEGSTPDEVTEII